MYNSVPKYKKTDAENMLLDEVPSNRENFAGPILKIWTSLVEIKESHVVSGVAVKVVILVSPCLLFSEFEYVELKDLEIVGTMGVGGFGRVELVQYKPNPTLTFALKCLKKIEMVQQQQQEHAYNEKHIMMACDSAFICK